MYVCMYVCMYVLIMYVIMYVCMICGRSLSPTSDTVNGSCSTSKHHQRNFHQRRRLGSCFVGADQLRQAHSSFPEHNRSAKKICVALGACWLFLRLVATTFLFMRTHFVSGWWYVYLFSSFFSHPALPRTVGSVMIPLCIGSLGVLSSARTPWRYPSSCSSPSRQRQTDKDAK